MHQLCHPAGGASRLRLQLFVLQSPATPSSLIDSVRSLLSTVVIRSTRCHSFARLPLASSRFFEFLTSLFSHTFPRPPTPNRNLELPESLLSPSIPSTSATPAVMIELFKSSDGLPPLPDYTLKPAPPLVPPIPDKYMAVIAPFVFYWVVSMFFHWIDVNDYFPQYRLHTPAELLKRNHVTRWEVVRDVFIQQLIQTVVGILLGMTEPDDMVGKEEYDVAVWAQRIRIGQRVVPGLLALVGINAKPLAERLAVPYPALSTIIAGGANASSVTFASWETLLAKAVYWFFIPALQYALGIVFVDTWQYFLHRLMHVNRWMYSESCSWQWIGSGANLLALQLLSTPATTGCMCRTPLVHSTTTRLRASSWTSSARVLLSRLLA